MALRKKLHNGKFQAGCARHLRDALPNASFIGLLVRQFA